MWYRGVNKIKNKDDKSQTSTNVHDYCLGLGGALAECCSSFAKVGDGIKDIFLSVKKKMPIMDIAERKEIDKKVGRVDKFAEEGYKLLEKANNLIAQPVAHERTENLSEEEPPRSPAPR